MKIRKELWFGYSLMLLIIVPILAFTPWAGLMDGHLGKDDLGHLGLIMLAMIVVAIMLGFPTALVLAWVFDVTTDGLKVARARVAA